MKSSTLGTNTSPAEVTNIDRFGFWVLISGKEYFLSYDDFPWFRKATVEQILHVELLSGEHLHWPELDVDLCLQSLEHPEAFPLIYQD
ncbi:TPA: DUF2442 domain-containing protein [Candidatus Sumerlaeota bacterium]|jgi:hypothetical protein|nr:DUF2442 domain-containing protein [Candidatus Sumerlaeota bacterium]